jgi:signal transduction histidine kinase
VEQERAQSVTELLPAVHGPRGHVAAEFLSEPAARSHIVQFYEEASFLYETVARFFGAGLAAGDRLLMIGTPRHSQGIIAALGEAVATDARRSGQLTVVDARELLDSFLVGGMPDPALFRAALERLLRVTQCYPGGRLRAFGEMVHLLWSDGHGSAALRLEELWNGAAQVHEFSLLCAYGFSSFREQRDGARFERVCHLHTHVIPAEGFSQLACADQRLREVSALQQRAGTLESEIRQRQAAEGALREVLEHRARVEAELRASLDREEKARLQAQADAAFRKVLMVVLGHELREPLNTILSTARLMTSRGELAADSQLRLNRVVDSGVTMQRMIEQIRDLARDRLATGISVSRTAARDLVPLVAKIVEEQRFTQPGSRIELRSEGRCMASVDADRFEQVVSNLLSNAVTYGDSARPILVTITRQAGEVSLSVHNHGRAIATESLPLLFDPFRMGRNAERRSEGLGLGLYICERVVRAHGGSLRVESSEDQGTRFEARFPHHADIQGSA